MPKTEGARETGKLLQRNDFETGPFTEKEKIRISLRRIACILAPGQSDAIFDFFAQAKRLYQTIRRSLTRRHRRGLRTVSRR